jgi:FAD synthetase
MNHQLGYGNKDDAKKECHNANENENDDDTKLKMRNRLTGDGERHDVALDVWPDRAAVFFDVVDGFDEERAFAERAAAMYNVRLTKVDSSAAGGLKSGLFELTERFSVAAVLLGTRYSDPDGRFVDNAFVPTDGDWPSLMRVMPLLSWRYADIWHFIRALNVPYCPLYDQGYTSIGAKHKTKPNPALRNDDGSYRAAHLLVDGTLERFGRQ